jgi:hypothetical protein
VRRAADLLTATSTTAPLVRARQAGDPVAVYSYKTVRLSGTGTSATVSGLALGRLVCFVVRAKNAIGASDFSAEEVCIDAQHSVRAGLPDGTALVKNSVITCPSSSLVTCEKGALEWESNAWYDPDAGDIDASTEVHACFNDVSCLQSGDKTSVKCATDLGYGGPLCGACIEDDDEVFLRNGLVCSECADTAYNVLAFVGLVGAVLVLIVYIAAIRSTKRRVGEHGGIIRRIAFSYMQMLGVLGIFKARGTKVFNEIIGKTSQVAGGSPTSLLPIKCLLRSQAYAPFVVNMMLPTLFAATIALVLVPVTLVKRAQERAVRKRETVEARRRARRALSDGTEDVCVAPTHEPVVDFGKCCGKLPTRVALRLPCCRRVASDEYVENSERAFYGLPRHPPKYRAWLDIDDRALGGVPHAVLVACRCCRVATREDARGAWRAAQAVRAERAPFKPLRRFVAVMVLVMYSLYPTLVASTASMFSCSDKIGDKYYLLADLSVTCYVGWHIAYTAFASISIAVYCLGTPIALASLLMTDCCMCAPPSVRHAQDGEVVEEEETARSAPRRKKCVCMCALRSSTPWGFRTASFRERFGLLVVGYDTARGPIVMSWEPLVVMLRKLFITLAGSLLRDPYVQIISALAILVGSLTLQALVQPYESRLLNVLDVGSLFVLVVTQVLSIVYLYLDSLSDVDIEQKGLTRERLSIGMTVSVFYLPLHCTRILLTI